ncbi:ATP-binding protein [Modestobacter lacusdianchii]
MDAPLWEQRPLPPLLRDQLPAWGWDLHDAADLTSSRIQLQALVLGAGTPPGDIADDVERLLLAYEELVSNGLRHGQAPVQAAVTAAGNGWLIDVTDTAVDRVPVPATDRDPAFGGLGLFLISRLCRAYGWSVTAGRKHVWGYVDLATVS